MPTLPTIAFVSDAIYPYNTGGKEIRLHEVTTRLAAQGYDVHLYCMKWWEGSNDRVEEGVHLHAICPLIPLYDGPRRSIKQGVLFGLACFKLLFAKFDLADVDHMPFFPLYSMRVVCWLKRKKMIGTWHEVWGKEYWQRYLGGFKGIIAAWIEQVSVWFPDKIIAVSEMTAGRLKKDLGFARTIEVIPNGVDGPAISGAKKSTVNSDIIYAGRLLTHKNIDVLIRAVVELKKALPDCQALIIGEGPEKEALIKLSDELGLTKNITFLPFQQHISTLYGYLKASKVFVLPSSREGFGLVVLEANSCGLPVVTINHPDNAAQDLITRQNGIVTELSPKSIAQAALGFLNQKNHPTIIVPAEYAWESISKQIAQAYQKV